MGHGGITPLIRDEPVARRFDNGLTYRLGAGGRGRAKVNKDRILTAALAAGLAWPSAAGAGAWPLGRGHGQAITAVSVHQATSAFGDDDLVDFSKVEMSVYWEHGLTDRLTAVARPAAQAVRIVTEEGAEAANGAGATEFALRWTAFRRDGAVVSLQAGAVTPGEVENAIGARLGEGGVDAEARILAGRGWSGRLPGFVEAQAAWRARSEGDPDEARLDLSIGVEAGRKWKLIAQSFSVWESYAREGQPEPAELHRVQLSGVRSLGPTWSVQVGVLDAVAGKATLDERAAFVALWMRY